MSRMHVPSRGRLPALVLVLVLGGFSAFRPQGAAAAEVQDEPLPVHFYYIPECPGCAEARAAVNAAEARFGGRIRVTRFDLAANEEAFDAYIERLDVHGIKTTPNMVVFVGDVALKGKAAIVETLVPTLERLLAAAGAPRSSSPAPGRAADAAPVERTTLAMVSAAALADGINPCAFATVILFVSIDRKSVV